MRKQQYSFGPPYVKRLAIRMLSCLSVCLTVTLVYCGQTVKWIEIRLGVNVGLGLATLC